MLDIDYNILFNPGESVDADLVLQKGEIQNIPLVSIIIPTYNRPKLLILALESALRQDFKNKYEIVVIDNCSSKEAFSEILESLSSINSTSNCNVSLYKCPSHSNSWNMGIVKSKANFIVMLHDDDLLEKNHLSLTYEIIRDKNADVLCSDSHIIFETEVLSKLNKFHIKLKETTKSFKRGKLIKLKPNDFYFENPAPNTGIMFRRDVAIKLGGFNFKFLPIPDYAFLYKVVKQKGTVLFLNSKLSSIRFCVNDGLKRETNLKVKVSINEIRKDIRSTSLLKFFDLGYFYFNNCLTGLELKNQKSGVANVKVFLLRSYTRLLSLADSTFRILFK